MILFLSDGDSWLTFHYIPFGLHSRFRSLAFFQDKALRRLLREKTFSDRILDLVRRNKLPRLAQLLRQCHKRGARLCKVLEKVRRASNYACLQSGVRVNLAKSWGRFLLVGDIVLDST